MYTEENEFNYDDYLNENENGDNNSGFNRTAILKIALILLCLILIIFLVFKLKNAFTKKEDDKTTPPTTVVVDKKTVFSNNVRILRVIGENYFFKQGNYPKEEGESSKLSVSTLIEKNLISEVVDADSKACSYNISYVSVIRNANDYALEVNLTCSGMSDKVVYYYDLDFNCLTCNGETYEPKEDTDTENNNESDNNGALVCGNYSEWGTEYKNDSNLDVETRVVVSAYKDEISYGEWSSYTESPVYGTEELEVETYQATKYVSSYSDWSSSTTKKPAAKEGREITSSKESSTSYQNKCTTKTYTRNRTTWDLTADKCTYKGPNNITCTYTEKTCESVPKTSTKTYYKYRDLITEPVATTFYRYRTINKNRKYISMIPENEIPDGYTKVEQSEVIQYRYRTKCIEK